MAETISTQRFILRIPGPAPFFLVGPEIPEMGGPADCWNWGKWGLREYIWKGPFLGWFHGLLVPVQENLSWLGCSSRPRTKYCCLTIHYFNTFYPIAQQAWQAVVPCRLSLNMCLWAGHWLYCSIIQYELHRESVLTLCLITEIIRQHNILKTISTHTNCSFC